MSKKPMRLAKNQIDTIKQAVTEVYGSDAQVVLFGSRVDDRVPSGDIDLLIQIDNEILSSFEHQFKLTGILQRRLGPQKIDIISYIKGYLPNGTQKEAITTGVSL